MDSAISTILITIVILATIFLILREVMCWYWKINERINLQIEQNRLLSKILNTLDNSEFPQIKNDKYSNPSNKHTSERKSKSSELVNTSKGTFDKDHGKRGEAFCLGCRKVDNAENLLYNENFDQYYHYECLKEYINK